MAQKKRSARPSGNQQSSGGPRRLGAQSAPARPASSGAARRAARSRKKNSSPIGWISIGVVVIVLAVFLIVHFSSSGNSTAGQSSGTNPGLASLETVTPVENVSAAVFNQVGTDGQGAPFELTATKKVLTSNGKVQFVYVGAEYCPYCAMMRWSLVAALSRFGTFTGLKQTSSANSDGNIPTFSFLGSSYKSKYVVFSPYETEDRNRNTLQTPPSAIAKIFSTYDSPPYTTSTNAGGIPFLSIGNRYVTGGDPQEMALLFENGTLVNGGPGRQAIADSLQNPSTSTGMAAGGPLFDAEANYLSAGICLTNGAKPVSVCASSGVKAAEKTMTALKVTK